MALEIYIPKDNPQYRLTSDSLCFTVESKHVVDPTKSPKFDAKKHDSTPKVAWRHPKYFPTLEQALGSLPDRFARDSDATTFAELLDEIYDFRREIRHSVSE